MPEGRFPLAQAALYLATCPKSNSTLAFFDALSAVENERDSEVPTHLRDGNRDKEGFGHGQGYLYPHAYRDHWVAQQYLPDALQGKLFYQPGDQGYERQIQLEVQRRREAQLAAMVEGETDAPLEILTTSPTNRARDAWLQRTITNSGRSLSRLREMLFDLAAIRRHHLILDVNAGSGLLTWEAVRQAPEGGVWALATDPVGGEALRQQAERLPEVERPTILIGDLDELDYLLNLRGEEDLRFDRIIGRNLFTHYAGNKTQLEVIGSLATWLREDGQLCLIQPVPRQGQRLYALVDWTNVTVGLAKKVRAAEEGIYSDETDPLVNWDESDLEAAFHETELAQLEIKVEELTNQRRITAEHLSRWFGESDRNGRASYGRRLVDAGLTPAELDQVAHVYRRQLLDQTVDWGSAIAYIVTTRSG
jgi:putative ATPase